jgi:biotin operon repressor
VKKQSLRATSLVAAGVVAGGILAGTLGAQAADRADDDGPGAPGHVRVHFEGPGGPHGGADLAKELGVSQKKLREAFESIGDQVRPAKRPDGPPSEADIKAMQSKLAAALADKLGLSESKVATALEKVRTEHEADRRDALSDRLDAAVKNGKLTTDDKASVLKAFDAGVLGGPGGRILLHRAPAQADD